MIRNVLIVGGGSKVGIELTKYYLEHGYNVDVITGSDINTLHQEYKNLNYIHIDWDIIENAPQTIKKRLDYFLSDEYDIIIFNQNNLNVHTSFELIRKNQHTEFIKNINTNILLPDIILRSLYRSRKIQSNTKVVFIISRIISMWLMQLSEHGDKAGYAAIKTLNFLFSKGYSVFNKGIYFCIEPGHFNKGMPGSIEQASRSIVNLIAKADPSFNGLAFESYNEQEEYNIINYED